MTKRLMISEIINRAEQLPVSEAVAFLQNNVSTALLALLSLHVDTKVKWNLPEGSPPFKPSEFDDRLRLYSEARKLQMFTDRDSRSSTIHRIRLEGVFISLLESLPAEEADLVIRLKDRQIKLKKSTINKAFGELT